MVTYELKKGEREILSYIAKSYECGKTKFTKPIIIAYGKKSGVVECVYSVKRWRNMLNDLPNFKYGYRFELRNLWV